MTGHSRILAQTVPVLLLGLAACTPRSILMPNLQSGERSSFFPQRVQMLHLPVNGIDVLLAPDDNTNLVKVDVRYPAGAMDEPSDRAGLAHLVEHLTYSVRHAGPDGPTLGQMLGDAALYYNATTNQEATQYTSMALGGDLPALLAIESQRMRSTCEQIDDRELARVREVVRNEIRERAGVGADLRRALLRGVYGAEHPYGRDVGGTDQTIVAITRDDVCGFLRDHYRPRGAVLAISGNFDQQTVKRLIKDQFGAIENRPGPRRGDIARLSLRGTSARHELPIAQATAVIAFEAPRLLDRRAVVGHLVAPLLSASMSELTGKHDFVDDVVTGTTGGSRARFTFVAVSVDDPERLDKAVELTFQRLRKLGKQLTAEQLNVLKNGARASLISSFESFARQNDILIEYLQAGDKGEFLTRDIAQVGTVTRQELRSYATDLFARDSSHVALFYPDPDARTVEQRAALEFDSGGHHDFEQRVVVTPEEAAEPVTISQRQPDAAKVRRIELANGMSVLLAPALSYPVVDIRVVFPVGRAHDPPDKPGLSTLAALLMEEDFNPDRFRGLTMRGARDVEFLFQMGGSFTVDVDDTATSFRMRGLSMFTDGLLWRLYFTLQSATYSDSIMAALHREIARRDESDDASPSWPGVVMTALFGKDYPLGLRGPSPDSVRRISTGDLERFRDRHYRPGGAAIIMTGQFDADYVESEIRRLFGSWEGDARSEPTPMPAPVERSAPAYFASIEDDEIQTRIVVAFATQASTRDRLAARLVLNEVLERKLKVLRSRLGATYGVEVSHTPLRGAGVVVISSSVDRERGGEALVAMRSALDEIRTGDFLAEFVSGRRDVVRTLLASTIDSRTVAGQLESLAMFGVDRDDRDDIVKRVASLQPEQVRELIERELAPTREVVVAVGRRAAVSAAYRAAGIERYRVVD